MYFFDKRLSTLDGAFGTIKVGCEPWTSYDHIISSVSTMSTPRWSMPYLTGENETLRGVPVEFAGGKTPLEGEAVNVSEDPVEK